MHHLAQSLEDSYPFGQAIRDWRWKRAAKSPFKWVCLQAQSNRRNSMEWAQKDSVDKKEVPFSWLSSARGTCGVKLSLLFERCQLFTADDSALPSAHQYYDVCGICMQARQQSEVLDRSKTQYETGVPTHLQHCSAGYRLHSDSPHVVWSVGHRRFRAGLW